MGRTRVFILGTGGVGGYYGGMLARTYHHNAEAEIVFLSRGAHAESIRANGLRLETTQGNLTVHPDMITDDAREAGTADILVCAVKTYDLEDALAQYASCIRPGTLIIPLMNGIHCAETIRKLLPQAHVFDACVYIVARLAEPGLIRETGKISLVFFGTGTEDDPDVELARRLFNGAGINAQAPVNILPVAWEKYLFISSVASLTCFYDCTIGEILSNSDRRSFLLQLILELKTLALGLGVALAENAEHPVISRLESLPPETTSSMHSDMKKGGRMEIGALTEYPVLAGRETGIRVPGFEKVLQKLLGQNMPV